jgi:hypothetical protein
MKPISKRILHGCILLLLAPVVSAAEPVFTQGAGGEFLFDTGTLSGKLRPGGKSLGLASVIHAPTGQRLDRSNGLFSHYRVFTRGVRYGDGAWSWPSEARLREDGAVEVRWAPAPERPFEMRSVYRWRGPATLDLETSVKAAEDLPGFEAFLASYFHDSFTNAAVFVARPPEKSAPGFMPALIEQGNWQMFPREPAIVPLIQDGRWQVKPSPVNWTMMPRLEKPLAFRRAPQTGVTGLLMSPPSDCFAISCPYETEKHFSAYLSLFGRDVKAGETVRARARLVIAVGPADREMVELYDAYLKETR